MAERRMFAKTIIDSDAFTDMPLSTQALYFHLSMRADDDGFLNNPKKIQRMVGCSDDDLKILIAKRFLIPFDSGVVVIKHWKIHNYIRSDRYKETVYTEEKHMLNLKNNGAYTLKSNDSTPLVDETDVIGIPSGIPDDNQPTYHLDTQVRLGKDSIVEDNKEKRQRKKKTDMTIDDIPQSFVSVLDCFGVTKELKEAFMYFILMRLKANSKFTEHALDLTIRKVRNMYPNNEKMQIACVNQSVEHGWLTLYELKDYKPMPSNNTASFATPVTLSFEEED